ncbi:HlyD family efflux transporter periplasmic adaptor subunit [Oceanobacillus kimchii]|uniref:HlyD family efflux transporter periplasmic adaptor subunit n=1 Tax=Oceanobacillus kimchii TaxID=746691 RepID=UPI00034AC894|nr:biotin/lipoyl-binding protein [Oceanobacillus kimchii]
MVDINSIKVESEIYKKKYSKTGLIIIYPFLIFIVVLLLFLFLADKEVYIEVPSSVNTYSSSTDIKSKVEGVVQSINVKNGDYVEAGDIIMEIDSQETKEEIKNIEQEIDRLNIEKSNIDNFKKSVVEKSNYLSEDNIEFQIMYNNYIIQTEKITLENRILTHKIEEVSNESIVEEYRLQQEINNKSQQELKYQLLIDSFQKEKNIIEKIDESLNTLSELESRRNNMILKSDDSGYVQFNNQVSIGSQIMAGDDLYTITTNDKSELYIQGLVSTDKISALNKGQKANFSIQNSIDKETNIVESEIINIGKTPVTTEEGNYYIIETDIIENDNLTLGMTGNLNIITDTVTYLDYFWNKLF